MEILPATFDDIPALETLIQNCYRGPIKGWTHDTHLLEGKRVNSFMLKKDLSNPAASFLKCVNENGELIGCVYVEKQKNNFLHCGTLCVLPQLQNCGLGKKMMTFVEDTAKAQKCCGVKIIVVAGRTTLIEWYERQGFKQTGETEPFPDTGCYGRPKVPLEFIVMQKIFN